jgi:hypothetical protein
MSDGVYIALGVFYGLVILLMLGGAFVFFNKNVQEKRARYVKQWKRRHLKLLNGEKDDSNRKRK